VKQFVHVQLGYITKYGLDPLLNVPDHLKVPIPLTQWIVDRIPYGGWCFKHKSKSINFHKDMVNIVFGLPSGRGGPSSIHGYSDESYITKKFIPTKIIYNI
jgi:hypothetical protein